MLAHRLGSWLGLSLILAAAATPTLALETVERTMSFEHPIGSSGSLRIENLLGSVELRVAADSDRVTVDVRVVGEAKTVEEARSIAESIELRRELSDGAALLHVAYPLDRYSAFRPPKAGVKGFVSRWAAPLVKKSATVDYDGRIVQVGSDRKAAGLAVHLTVSLPLDVEATVVQTLGAIHGRSVRGKLVLETVQGDVAVERVFGELQLRSERGSISVGAFQGELLDVRTVSGDVELLDARAEDLRLRSGEGAIRGQDVRHGRMLVESVAGPVKLEGVDGAELNVRTGSGSVDLSTHLRKAERASIHSAAGDVTLRVGPLTHFDLLAVTKSGEVKSGGLRLTDLGRKEGALHLRHGKGGVSVQVSAGGGSMTVRPYEPVGTGMLLGKRGR